MPTDPAAVERLSWPWRLFRRVYASPRLAPAAAWLLGTVFFFHQMFLSGFDRITGDFADSRLCNYLLEHTFLWLTGRPGHERLWDLPIFHPAANVFAYSESFLGVAPLYWIWRLVGLPADTAFQAWLLTVASLGFVTAWLFLARGLGFHPGAASLGAFLCAYGNLRAAQLHHPQLLVHFYTFLALYFLARWLRGPAEPGAAWRVAGFVACVVLQTYGSFYLGWFLVLGLAVAGVWGLLLPACRPRLLAALRRQTVPLAVSLVAAALALLPLALQGLQVARESGWRPYEEVAALLPKAQAWIYMGRRSVLYHGLRDLPLFQALSVEHEQRLGLGLATLLCVGIGFWRARRRPWAPLLLLSGLSLVLLATDFGGFSLWHWVWAATPGGGAIRAVSRIGLLLLVPAGVGLACFVQGLRPRSVPLFLVLALCVAEQAYLASWYSKAQARSIVDSLARQVEPGCRSFYLSVVPGPGDDGSAWLYQVDAVTTQLAVEIPAVNGYSGRNPPGYGSLFENVIRSGEDRRRLHADLAAWQARHGLSADAVCAIEAAAPY
jgi:hypothetical protein